MPGWFPPGSSGAGSLVGGASTAVIGVPVAFGLNISDTQQNAIIGAAAPLAALIALVGPCIRQFL